MGRTDIPSIRSGINHGKIKSGTKSKRVLFGLSRFPRAIGILTDKGIASSYPMFPIGKLVGKGGEPVGKQTCRLYCPPSARAMAYPVRTCDWQGSKAI